MSSPLKPEAHHPIVRSVPPGSEGGTPGVTKIAAAESTVVEESFVEAAVQVVPPGTEGGTPGA